MNSCATPRPTPARRASSCVTALAHSNIVRAPPKEIADVVERAGECVFLDIADQAMLASAVTSAGAPSASR